MFSSRPGPATLALLALFALSYLAQALLAASGVDLVRLLALTYDLTPGLAWRWLTYPLVEAPGNLLGRLIGLVMAYLMLSQHERRHGARTTLALALAGIAGAAALSIPFGLLGVATPLVGLSPLLWAPIGRLLVDAGDQPVSLFGYALPNARVATAVLLLLPAASALYAHDPTPILEALGAGVAGVLVGLRAIRATFAPRRPARPPLRRHGLQVIRGGKSDDDERPKYLN